MSLVKLSLAILIFSGAALAKPFLLKGANQALARFVSSASSSTPDASPNIEDLTADKDKDSLEDFFKQSVEDYQETKNDEEEEMNLASPNLLQKKIGKILRKLNYLSKLGQPSSPMDQDGDFQQELDDFDKEFEQDAMTMVTSEAIKEDLIDDGGYTYPKPVKPLVLSEKQENGVSFNPGNIGVFFMELIGSLVGLAYGAAAQLNYPATTPSPP